jgi:hypothetical protein
MSTDIALVGFPQTFLNDGKNVDVYRVRFGGRKKGHWNGQLVFRLREDGVACVAVQYRAITPTADVVTALYLADALMSDRDVATRRNLYAIRDQVSSTTYCIRGKLFRIHTVTETSFLTREAGDVGESVVCGVAGTLEWL